MKSSSTRFMFGALFGASLLAASACSSEPEPLPSDPQGGGGQTGQTSQVSTTTGAGGSGDISWNEGGAAGVCEEDQLLGGATYAAKVKTLLTGQPLTVTEDKTMRETPEQLPTLIDAWLQTPQAEHSLERWFTTAFQANGMTRENFLNMLGINDVNLGRFIKAQLPPGYASNFSPRVDELYARAFSQSMAKTALKIAKDGKPFHEAITTSTYMLNTAMVVYLAFNDDNRIDDDKKHVWRTTTNYFDDVDPNLPGSEIILVRDPEDAPPIEEALDPNHANFGRFHHPRLKDIPLGPCQVSSAPETLVVRERNSPGFTTGDYRPAGVNLGFYVYSHIALGRSIRIVRQSVPGCNFNASAATPPMLKYEDFFDWRPVTIRQPQGNETPSLFVDVAGLRNANELVLHTPRHGFVTHPGFLGTWMTNEDNGSRVTANQALVVGLGQVFKSGEVPNYAPTNVDMEHAGDTDCYACHQTLDPMRDLFRASMTNYYGQQLDPARKDKVTDFVFDGTMKTGLNGLDDFTKEMANHSAFARAWVQKLCYFANAEACHESDELDRVVKVFEDSNYDFFTMLRELFSSPLVTGARCLDGVPAGTTATINRRSTFCNTLSERFEVPDVCGLQTDTTTFSTIQSNVVAAVESVPDDGFSRDQSAPITIAATGMFVRANREVICNKIGFTQGAILFPEVFKIAQEQPDVTPEMTLIDKGLTRLVIEIMGLTPQDPRYEPAIAILREHVDQAVAEVPNFEEYQNQTLSPGMLYFLGLVSATPIACMAPSVTGIGF